MAYEKQSFVAGQTLTAAQMNHIEEGIAAAHEAIENLPESSGGVVIDATLSKSGAAADAKIVGDIVTVLTDKIDDLENGAGASGGVVIDATLSKSGAAADAKAVGDIVTVLAEELETQNNTLSSLYIEGYERIGGVGGYYDVTDNAVWHEGAYLYRGAFDNAANKYTIAMVEVSNWAWGSLAVSSGEKYRVTTRHGQTPHAAYALDKDGYLIKWFPEDNPTTANYDPVDVEIPNGCVELRVNSVSDFSVKIEKLGEDGLAFGKTEDFARTSNTLYGKKLACVGDSITEATIPDGGYFKNYAEVVAERNEMSVYKDGKGGSTMANTEGHNPFCVDRYLAVPSNFDILTIWFGWNDAAYSQVGTINDTDDTTYYGAYKKVLEHFITTYPTKKIGLIVPYGNESVEPFREAVRKLSEMYGVPCLDLADGKQCSLLWGTANAAQQARRAALTYDGTHPNQAGHEYLSTMYEEFIRRL